MLLLYVQEVLVHIIRLLQDGQKKAGTPSSSLRECEANICTKNVIHVKLHNLLKIYTGSGQIKEKSG